MQLPHVFIAFLGREVRFPHGFIAFSLFIFLGVGPVEAHPHAPNSEDHFLGRGPRVSQSEWPSSQDTRHHRNQEERRALGAMEQIPPYLPV